MVDLPLPAGVREGFSRAGILWLGSADARGIPCVSPKEIFTSFGERIIIADTADSICFRNVRERPEICLSFFNWVTDEGYAINSRVEYYRPGDDSFDELDRALREVATPERPIEVIYAATIIDHQLVPAPRVQRHPNRPRRAMLVHGANQRIELI